MSLTSKLKSAGLWQSLQVLIQIVTQFGYIAVMARLLSKADFGLMAIANGFIGIGMLFSTAGMGSALIQYKNPTQKHINSALQGSFLLSLLVFLIIYFSSSSIAEFYKQPELEIIVKIIGLGIILNSINSISRSLLQKHFKFKITTNITVFATIIGYGVGVILALSDYGVWSLIIATLIISFLNAFFMFYFAPVEISLKFYYEEFKELFSFGFGMILLSINNYLSGSGLNLILGKIMVPSQLGVFERTNQIKTLPGSYIGNVLDTIMFPAMAGIQDESERLFRVFQHSLGLVNSILMPVTIFLILFSKEVVLIVLGDKWLEAVVPLQIMFLVLPLSSSGRMADSVVRATGLIYKNVIRKFLYVLVLITSVAIGGSIYGLIGAAVAVTFSYLFNYVLMLVLVKQIFNKSPNEIFIKPIWAGLKLTLLVLVPIVVFTTLLNAWEHESIFKFILITLMVGVTALSIAWKMPSLMGIYLHDTIKQLIKKKK